MGFLKIISLPPSRAHLQSSIVPPEKNKTMAIYPLHGAETRPPSVYQQPFNIEIWTEETARAVGASSLQSPGRTRHTIEALTIPIEEELNSRRIHTADDVDDSSTTRHRREPLRRDSLKRREALLKGKEGSRRRQRWENGSCYKLSLLPPSWR